MARKINKKQQERMMTILTYARALNLHTIEAYQQWCMQQGFSTNLNKTRVQLDREHQHYKQVSALQKLKHYKREENRRYLINKIYSNEIQHKDLNNDVLKQISHGFKTLQNKRLLRDVFLYLEEHTKLLDYTDYVKAIIAFVKYHTWWHRPLMEWQPKTRNAERQFSALARYLFAKYEVPAFMDSVWFKEDTKSQRWFIHIGDGKNIRTAFKLPIRMTKKMAHFFIQAPAHYEINAAFRWAQIHALGGNKAIADAVAETQLARVFVDHEFCLSIMRFFIDNPMLDVSQYNPIVDYIWNQKYENRIVFIERGVAREEGPAQPNFSMKGRTPDTLLNQVEAWHRQLGRELRGGDLQWVKSEFKDYRYVEGRANSHNMKVWTISELLSSNELIAEGRKQSHCVASYARSCFTGKTSIWTMEIQNCLYANQNQMRQKLLTIELHTMSKTIRQIRGLRNRLASSAEMEIIYRWARKQGFAIAKYV
ncbi:MAG: PcfJ domain-containing protein [Gammaproteobacteria bacterium]|nr:PcfJ domain-containing protein [Gammaproteobacteria bacterium]